MSNELTLEQISELKTPGEYIIREGSAQTLFYQKESNHSGILNAPTSFFTTKYAKDGKYDFKDMLVKYNMEAGTIDYFENNSTDEKGAKISGSLTINSNLKKLGINENKIYTTQQLADVLKFNRLLFASADDGLNMVTKLKNFTASVTQHISEVDDKQGTKNISYAHKISHDLNLTFTLSTNILQGNEQISSFQVNVHFDLRDKAIEFWLESVELKEIIDDIKAKQFALLLTPFIEKGVPVIQIG